MGLRWLVCRANFRTNDCFEPRSSFYEKWSDIFPEIIEPLFRTKSRQIPAKIPSEKSKQKSPTSFRRSAGRTWVWQNLVALQMPERWFVWGLCAIEPLLEKEASPAVLGGREFWKCSGAFKCLELQGLGHSSRTLEGNSRQRSESVSGSFRNFSRISSGKPQPYWGCGLSKR